ncbi:MAG: hypothetical protein KDB14_00725 [Planctomycetales bacterium]|nr:hypothetical protein [Planctomycetales bacterium]
MSRSRSRNNPTPPESRPAEERSTEAMTIAWMLATMSTLMAMGASLLAYLLNQLVVKSLPQLLLLVSLISGLVVVVLTPLVLRLRKSKPPAAVTWFAVIVGLTPVAIVAVIELISS